MTPQTPPRRVVHAVAPIRICDNGGWTDTWFAGHGRVLNIGVYPYVEVEVAMFDRAHRDDRIVLDAENYGDRYAIVPGEPLPDRHPLLEAAIDEAELPDDVAVEISVYSEAPAGGSTGTSAAVAVALIGALRGLLGEPWPRHEVAEAAHRIEVERLGRQSGIQDQLCAAYGGINYIEMDEYPRATVTPIALPDPRWWELERRLALVFLGRTHVSSEVHERVIADFESGGGAGQLEVLRSAATDARDALQRGDLEGFGRSMTANTEAQAAMHRDLVSDDARAVIEVAKAHGAVGWKVNGAGGEGGSLTLLCGPSSADKRRMVAALREANPLFQVIPTYLSRAGLRVWG